MKLTISDQILERYPKLNIGIVVAKGIDNKEKSKEVGHLLKEIGDYIKLNFIPEQLSKHELISPWRVAFSEFGAKPSKYSSSIEAMMKRILKGDKIPNINKIVDLYNYLSLKHIMPMGADDLDQVKDYIQLTIEEGNEEFVPLGQNEIEHPNKGEIIYRDEFKVLCRRWNWRDSDETKITDKTKNLILYIEGISPITKKKLIEVCKEMVELVTTFCGGESKYYILNKEKSSVEF